MAYHSSSEPLQSAFESLFRFLSASELTRGEGRCSSTHSSSIKDTILSQLLKKEEEKDMT
jgi:hypothetical protein